MAANIYLAGSCSIENRTLMNQIATELRKQAFKVHCPFETEIPEAWNMSQEAWGFKVFEKDVEAIDNCDIFLMISPGRHSTAGTNWEQGYAFAKRKPVIVIQYTLEQTSLMTFCGCSFFVNTDSKDMIKDTLKAVQKVSEGLSHKVHLHENYICKTTLT